MKPTTLAQLMALPAVLANFAGELTIVVRDDDLHDVQVAGKVDPDEKMTWMNYKTPGIDQTVKCLGEDKSWTFRGCGQSNRVGYRQVGLFNFSKTTEDPRPFVIDLSQGNTQLVSDASTSPGAID